MPARLLLMHEAAVQGMLRSVVVGQFFRDLKNPAYTTAFAVYHRRFSTNTTPKWPLAQPMRVLGHNGVPLCGYSGVKARRQQPPAHAVGRSKSDGSCLISDSYL